MGGNRTSRKGIATTSMLRPAIVQRHRHSRALGGGLRCVGSSVRRDDQSVPDEAAAPGPRDGAAAEALPEAVLVERDRPGERRLLDRARREEIPLAGGRRLRIPGTDLLADVAPEEVLAHGL